MEKRIEQVVKKFIEKIGSKEVYLISHYDTDGITSAAIMIKTLKKLDVPFTVQIINNLEEKIIQKLPKDKIIVFLDLASGSLNYISKSKLQDVFIIDHHEIIQEIPEEINIINPQLDNKESISSSGLTYLFCKKILKNNNEDKKLAKLAILGMVGDSLEKNIDKINSKIIDDNEIIKKRGLLLYPSTRPINRVLEFSSNPYIPGVTGDTRGTLELLRETGLTPKNGKYKSIIELNEIEMTKLVTSILLKVPKKKHEEIIGDIFLIKLFNKLEDARELSAVINACSRLGEPETAIQVCLEISEAKKRAESLHAKNRRQIISGLEFISNSENSDKIEGKGYVIINAKNNIRETIIGTIASIISNSDIYEYGTIIITMAHYNDSQNKKIKVSARTVGKNGRNVREILNNTITKIGGEVGGHEFAAGAIINHDKEQEFIINLKKNLEIEVVKV